MEWTEEGARQWERKGEISKEMEWDQSSRNTYICIGPVRPVLCLCNTEWFRVYQFYTFPKKGYCCIIEKKRACVCWASAGLRPRLQCNNNPHPGHPPPFTEWRCPHCCGSIWHSGRHSHFLPPFTSIAPPSPNPPNSIEGCQFFPNPQFLTELCGQFRFPNSLLWDEIETQNPASVWNWVKLFWTTQQSVEERKASSEVFSQLFETEIPLAWPGKDFVCMALKEEACL